MNGLELYVVRTVVEQEARALSFFDCRDEINMNGDGPYGVCYFSYRHSDRRYLADEKSAFELGEPWTGVDLEIDSDTVILEAWNVRPIRKSKIGIALVKFVYGVAARLGCHEILGDFHGESFWKSTTVKDLGFKVSDEMVYCELCAK